jgi:hypothetical protein
VIPPVIPHALCKFHQWFQLWATPTTHACIELSDLSSTYNVTYATWPDVTLWLAWQTIKKGSCLQCVSYHDAIRPPRPLNRRNSISLLPLMLCCPEKRRLDRIVKSESSPSEIGWRCDNCGTSLQNVDPPFVLQVTQVQNIALKVSNGFITPIYVRSCLRVRSTSNHKSSAGKS